MKFEILVIAILMIGLVSAVPQVITSPLHLDVKNTTLRIVGEGINYNVNLTIVNDSIQHYIADLNLVIIRDINCSSENKNVSVSSEMLRALTGSLDLCTTTFNFTQKWEDCINVNRDIDVKYLTCMMDVGYKTNYSICMDDWKNEVTNLNSQITQKETDKNTQVNEWRDKYNNEINKKYYFAIGAAIIVFGYFYFRGKGFKFPPKTYDTAYPPGAAT